MGITPGLLGHYEIISPLGAGGMGEVYLAQDTRLGRRVALKLLPEEVSANEQRLRRFFQEARAASTLNHPNILTVYELGETNSSHFIVTEFVDGVTVRERLRTSQLDICEALDIVIQVAEGLSAAHDAGIIHRDIKPENIMLRKDGYVKILDFGLAKPTAQAVIDPEAATLLQTTDGIVLGTVSYMSPEQARGFPVDARTDIFSLGVVLYEMLTGRLPFAGATGADLIVSILETDPAPLAAHSRDIPEELEQIVSKALTKDRNRRYQTVRGLATDLRKVKQELPNLKLGLIARLGTGVNGRVRKAAWIALAGLLIVVLVSTAYFLRHRLWNMTRDTSETITLAVLPFRILNEQDEIGFLAVGIPDAIITRLANFRRVRVRSTSAILRYESQNVDLQEAGRSLATEYVVAGTVQKVGDRLRVGVQLVRTSDGGPLWGEHYDNARTDLLTLQDVIAGQVATALKIKMTANEEARFYRRYTQNMAAYELYLRGRSQLAHPVKEGVLNSVDAFESALRLDPNYALARAGLAMACADMHLYFAPEAEVKSWGDRAKQEAQKAIEIDPDLAETHQALAAVYGKTEFNWDGTIRECEKALELNPSLELPHYLRGRAFYHLGLLEQGDRDVRDGLELNPSRSNSEYRSEALRTKGIVALLSKRFDQSVTALEEVHRLNPGPSADWWLAQAYYYDGKEQQSEALLSELGKSTSASGATRSKAILASFLAARGQRSEAEELARTVQSGQYMDHHVAYGLGVTYAQLGQREEAIRWLGKAADTGFPCYPWYASDPLLEPLRKEPEFQRLLRDLQQSMESAKAEYKL